jgi:hypothetical protein
MDPSTNLVLFIAGVIIGLLVALIGGIVEYWLSLRRNGTGESNRLPGCLLYVSGGLVVAGIISLAASFLLTGGIRPALVLGAGVLSGFYVGFIFLFVLWLLLESR